MIEDWGTEPLHAHAGPTVPRVVVEGRAAPQELAVVLSVFLLRKYNVHHGRRILLDEAALCQIHLIGQTGGKQVGGI